MEWMGTSIMFEKDFPLEIVGSNQFGRYPKIGSSQTFNMIITDGWLVPFAGYKLVAKLLGNGPGRGIFASGRYGNMIAVVNNKVFVIGPNLSFRTIGTLNTATGDVFIDENNGNQICICDQSNLYIYNTTTGEFSEISLDFIPGYIEFQDGYFIAPASGTSEWRLSAPNDGTSWPAGASNTGLLQTKPDEVQACVRFPGKGNLLLVFGKTVTEMWYDTGVGLFPYQKNTFNNIDYGCLNKATIAANNNILAWVGINEKAGPIIMITDGINVKQISNDGINFKLANLTKPSNCYGFFVEQDGRQFYLVTWPSDNLTFLVDFDSSKFFTLTDENMGFHIAKRAVFFNNKYYFISDLDGSIYEMNSTYTTYDGATIPRIRVCNNISLPDQSKFIVRSVGFTMEQGDSRVNQRVDISFSNDGGESFSSYVGVPLNPLGQRRNRFFIPNLGYSNDFLPQFRFWGDTRFVCTNGLVSIYK